MPRRQEIGVKNLHVLSLKMSTDIDTLVLTTSSDGSPLNAAGHSQGGNF